MRSPNHKIGKCNTFWVREGWSVLDLNRSSLTDWLIAATGFLNILLPQLEEKLLLFVWRHVGHVLAALVHLLAEDLFALLQVLEPLYFIQPVPPLPVPGLHPRERTLYRWCGEVKSKPKVRIERWRILKSSVRSIISFIYRRQYFGSGFALNLSL